MNKKKNRSFVLFGVWTTLEEVKKYPNFSKWSKHRREILFLPNQNPMINKEKKRHHSQILRNWSTSTTK
jgi:hypothetical protein